MRYGIHVYVSSGKLENECKIFSGQRAHGGKPFHRARSIASGFLENTAQNEM
jgi:hypothetical protein